MAEEIIRETEEVSENTNFIYNFIKEDIAEGGQFAGKTVHKLLNTGDAASLLRQLEEIL